MTTYYQKNKEKMMKYYRSYYATHKEEILNKSKEKYLKTKKKVGKCKMCGDKLPKELSGHYKYCEKCLYSKGHGLDAHRMAAARYCRKKTLDKKETNK